MVRDLWIRTEGGQRQVVGIVHFEPKPEEGVRLIKTKPEPRVRANHSCFSWLLQQLHQDGYTPTLYPDGSIEFLLPLSDKFGHLLSKIAYTYRQAEMDGRRLYA